MALASRTPGTGAYKRRQARIAARKERRNSTKPVGASLDPETMNQYINEYYEEQGQRSALHDELQDTLIADPLQREKIAREWREGSTQRAQSLAERGLSAKGYDAGDLADLTRTRVEATKAQDLAVRTAQAKYNAAMQDLNNRRTALDKNYAAIAGRNIQAGTGKYKNQKPAGWKPPSLPTTAPGGGNTAAPAQGGTSAPATVGSQPAAPTGARPSTTGATTQNLRDPAYLAKMAKKAGAVGGFSRRRRIRAA